MARDAQLYRDQAATVVALAEAADDPAIRAELLSMAERFIKLSEHATRFGRQYGDLLAGSPADPDRTRNR